MRGLSLGLGLELGPTSSGPAWTPLSLPNLQLWGKASSGTVPFIDYGPNGLSFSVSTGTPTYNATDANFNNQPTCSFNGSAAMTIPNIAALQIVGGITILAVIRFASFSTYNCVVAKGVSGSTCEYDLYVQSNSELFATRRASGSTNQVNTPAIFGTGSAFAIGYTDDGSGSSTSAQTYKNGSAQTTNRVTSGTTSTTTNALFIGKRSDGASILNGTLAELIICSSVLSSGNLSTYETYAHATWGT